MSVAGGWFFLMACEMFVLGNRDFRLPGLGSFLQTAASSGNTSAILWGVATMIAVIVLLDQLVWRPIIVWADKFKFEQVESTGGGAEHSAQPDRPRFHCPTIVPASRSPVFDWLSRTFTSGARRAADTFSAPKQHAARRWIGYLLATGTIVGLGFAVFHAAENFPACTARTISSYCKAPRSRFFA